MGDKKHRLTGRTAHFKLSFPPRDVAGRRYRSCLLAAIKAGRSFIFLTLPRPIAWTLSSGPHNHIGSLVHALLSLPRWPLIITSVCVNDESSKQTDEKRSTTATKSYYGQTVALDKRGCADSQVFISTTGQVQLQFNGPTVHKVVRVHQARNVDEIRKNKQKKHLRFTCSANVKLTRQRKFGTAKKR